MDFFGQQDRARKQTRIMLFYFFLALFFTILLVYFIPVVVEYFYYQSKEPQLLESAQYDLLPPFSWWQPQFFLIAVGGTLMVVLGGTLFKMFQLRSGGGESVALALGGRQIYPETSDFFEKRLLNIVEEMAIASGVPVPPVYVLEREEGINAFAAGFSTFNSVVAVSYGAMTGLRREELQGVVAHEFSHILNNDVRMNINLMAIIHGLIVVSLLGQIILQITARSSSSQRRSRDSGQVALVLMATGVLLWIVGLIGMFFGSLIKASISRERERLADASAVQFTRNPDGLVGALKKIGGLSGSSILQSPNAELASHMYFANGLKRNFFSTHPPLKDRVRWLDPSFDGHFTPLTYKDLQKEAQRQNPDAAKYKKTKHKEKKNDVVDLFTDPTKLTVTATVLQAATAKTNFKPNNPEALIDSIGNPMKEHSDWAQKLIQSIPDEIKNYSRNPYGARMLIYLLLFDSDPLIQEKQMKIVKEQEEEEVFQIVEKARLKLKTVRPEWRLPIVDLSFPALRFLSKDQYKKFRAIVEALSEADHKISLFEYALKRLLIHHLDPFFSDDNKSHRRVVNYYAIQGVQKEFSLILSILAWYGASDKEEAQKAFDAAVEVLEGSHASIDFLKQEEAVWDKLDRALDTMNECSFKVKKWLLGSALKCIMWDQKITVEEAELFRALSDSLDCPVPLPIVATTEI